MEQALFAAVGLDEVYLGLVAARETEVVDRGPVDREDAAGRAVLGRHVGDRRPVGQPKFAQPGTEELDELADHAVVAEHLGDP